MYLKENSFNYFRMYVTVKSHLAKGANITQDTIVPYNALISATCTYQ